MADRLRENRVSGWIVVNITCTLLLPSRPTNQMEMCRKFAMKKVKVGGCYSILVMLCR
jgi:hypothetical protein